VSAVLAGRPGPRPVLRAAVPAALLALGMLATQLVGATSAAAQPAASDTAASSARAASSASGSGAFHQTRTITRTNLINGKNVVVDKRTVSLSVNVTDNLIDRQIVNVSWQGAHPTGGIQTNPNQPDAEQEEYPMVLLECHGDTSPSAPTSRQIQPKDCWTATPTERFFSSGDAFPPWRLDRYATAADQRNLTENAPRPVPADCFLSAGIPTYWLPYVSSSGKGYPIGPGGCAGMPNEMSLTGGLGELPSNETYAATELNGRGSSGFDIWTNELNPDLGCSQSVSCALVAVPVMGVSCDPAAAGMPAADRPTSGAEEEQAAAECEETGGFAPGSLLRSGELNQEDVTVSGQLWWAASNWRNRFVVPLHFAPPADICSIVNKTNHVVEAYGSELLDQAALQWQPHFCLNKKLFTLGVVQTSEPEAATELQSGTIESALVSDQPSGGFPKPVVHAPVADTGFAISFVIDNSHNNPVTTLRLDPRLLAKLLTESYPAVLYVADNDRELLHACPGVPVPGSGECTNPLNITLDPEFRALNPGITQGVGASAAASVLLALSTNSDVMRALTSYINDNKAARAWLNGQPDPWGMTVNSAYRGIHLPVAIWPLRSIYEPADWKTSSTVNPCYFEDPTPVLPLIAAPIPDLPDIAEDIQFYLSQSELGCTITGNGSSSSDYQLVALGPETVGYRFMIGVTSLADARRYDLNTASLLTHTLPGTPSKFTSAAGMEFVAPTNAALRSAAALLVPDKAQHHWTFPYALYEKNSVAAEHAYPGSMLVYADIPTSGLPKADAADFATFLRFAGAAGQQPGGAIGQLPSGYLPMTAGNHLGAEAAYTLSAATAVADQKGTIPPLLRTHHAGGKGHGKGSNTGSGTGGSGTGGSGTGGSGTGGAGSRGPISHPKPRGTTVPLSRSHPVATVALTPAQDFGLAGYVLPGVAGLALAGALAAALTSRLTRSRRRPWG